MSDHMNERFLEKKRQIEQQKEPTDLDIQSKRGRKPKPITSTIKRGPRGGYYFIQDGKKIYLSTRH